MAEKRVVGVRFRHAGKVYHFDPGEASLKPGDTVIVETVRGVEAAEVVLGPRMVPETNLTQPLRPVLRQATAEDLAKLAENREKEKEALRVCAQKIAEHKLDMNLVSADYTFDRGKLIFYFTSEGRVDFRQLVRDLSATFKTRIELRQIGVRDEAKMIGGIGSCGRQLCCRTFLSEFQPVSIRMAKKQDLSLNPSKISGLCGRLMCCLRFESESYADAKTAGAGQSGALASDEAAAADAPVGPEAVGEASPEPQAPANPAPPGGEDQPPPVEEPAAEAGSGPSRGTKRSRRSGRSGRSRRASGGRRRG